MFNPLMINGAIGRWGVARKGKDCYYRMVETGEVELYRTCDLPILVMVTAGGIRDRTLTRVC